MATARSDDALPKISTECREEEESVLRNMDLQLSAGSTVAADPTAVSPLGSSGLAFSAGGIGDSMSCEHAVQLQERYGRTRASAILSKLQSILPLIEEANELTAELRNDKDFELRFRGEVFSDVTAIDEAPEIAVVLHRRAKPTEALSPCKDSVACLWTVDKFRHRLEVMRHIHNVIKHRAEPWGLGDDQDPWMDAEVPFVNPDAAIARSAANASLQAEVEQLRSQLQKQSNELEILTSIRERLVQDVVAAKAESTKLEAKIQWIEESARREKYADERHEEVRAVLKPDWLEVLGALRERRQKLEEPKMHEWLDPSERLTDFAQKLSCNVPAAIVKQEVQNQQDASYVDRFGTASHHYA